MALHLGRSSTSVECVAQGVDLGRVVSPVLNVWLKV